jgi:hypothetical protein
VALCSFVGLAPQPGGGCSLQVPSALALDADAEVVGAVVEGLCTGGTQTVGRGKERGCKEGGG